jgi:tetratricopeptide (TPR) repeat protein
MTGDTTKNLWKNWIQDNLIAYLSNSEELKVRQMESIKGVIQGKGLTENASITPSLASAISQTLDANVFIYGSINQSDTVLRVNTKLIDSKTEEIFKSFQIDGNVKKILSIIDSLSKMVKDFLVLSKFEKETPLAMKYLTTTASPEAYQYFMFGNNAFSKGDFPASIKLFSQALAIDSNLTFANILIAYAYGNQGFSDEARKYILRIYRKRDMMPQRERIWTNYAHAEFFETPNESIRYLRQLQELDDQVPNVYGNLGGVYFITHQYDNSIIELRKGLEIYKKWNAKPFWSNDYSFLGMAYYKTGQNKKAKEVFEKGEQDFPYASDIPYYKSILLLNEGDSIGADKSMKKFISLYKEWSASEADITTGLAEIYSEAGIPEKAEIFFRQGLSLEPENPVRLKNLAYFLIDKNLNVNEGMELIDKALELNPDSMSYFKFIFTDCKGWGLFRQGKHKEALEILKKNWDERPDYNHDAFLHLEAAKKAVAALK